MNQNLFMIAIAKKLKNNEKLPQGEYKVSGKVVVDVDAVIKKCAEESYTPTNSLPWQSILAVLVKKYNIKQAELENIILNAVDESNQNNTSIADSLAYTQRALDRVERTIAKLPNKTREGKTLINGTVNIITIKNGLIEKVN